VSWAESSAGADADIPTPASRDVARRLEGLEDAIRTLTLAVHAPPPPPPAQVFLDDLEDKLANAVTVSLSAALEAIKVALTEAVGESVRELATRLEKTAVSSADVESIAASLQHSVLLTLTSFEQAMHAASAPLPIDTMDPPATARDMARVNHRLDELREMLLG
jgi:hypothetical protein